MIISYSRLHYSAFITDAVNLAAVLNDDYSIITTSSCDFIPAPAIGNEPVVERVDFLFAGDDYLVWPQPYSPALPHLPFISRRELDLTNPTRKILWQLPERREFIPSHDDACTGLGMLAESKSSALRVFYDSLFNRMRQEACLTFSKHTKPLWDLLFGTCSLFVRLEQLTMGYRQVCRTVRAVQRNLLEADAYISYFIKYDLLSTSAPDYSKNYSPTVGAFVYNIEHLQHLQRMGVYHWLIRPYENCRHCVIKEVVTLLHPSDLNLATTHFSFASPIFTGRSSDPKKYMFIHGYSRNCIRFPDPFHCRVLPEMLAPSIGLSRSSLNRQRALTPRQRQLKGGSDR